MKLHPETGLHYIVSFPPGPAFQDARRLYQAVSQRKPWVTEILYSDLLANFERFDHKTTLIVVWGTIMEPPPPYRKCKIARVYSEALDEDSTNMLPRHIQWLALTRRRLGFYDAVFCHTPWMASQFEALCENVAVLPMGWDPHVLGQPEWSAKKFRFTYAGVNAGKRQWMVPEVRRHLGDQFNDATGQWGPQLVQTYNQSEANLYLSHCDIRSFSTFRIWHSVASSAALIAEKDRDCWPVTDDLYIQLPAITQENVVEVSGLLCDLPTQALEEKSRALHEGLASFTIDHIVDHYLVPASVKIHS